MKKQTGKYFIANEVEKTPVYQQKTLFVTGVQPYSEVIELVRKERVSHVYLGADESTNADNISALLSLAESLIRTPELKVTLDYFIEDHNVFVSSIPTSLTESKQFIAMVSIRMPNVNKMPLNTTIKLCDSGFDETNTGVWCSQLHELTSPDKITYWSEYKDDKAVSL